MKIWFESCINYTKDSDCPVQLGLNYFKHNHTNPKFRSWRGFSVVVHFFKWTVILNYVDDFDAYDRKINRHKYRGK